MSGERNLSQPGERFGKLVIKKRWTKKVGNKKGKETFCECQCDCGKTITVRARYLRSGHKKSCGCLKFKCNKESLLWRGHGDISSTTWTRIKSDAKDRNIDFYITIEQVWDLFLKQGGKCALSGVEIGFPYKSCRYEGAKNRTASLDRKDSSKGYTIDNVQWVHKHINFMKRSLTDEVFIDWCEAVVNHSKLNKSTYSKITEESECLNN